MVAAVCLFEVWGITGLMQCSHAGGMQAGSPSPLPPPTHPLANLHDAIQRVEGQPCKGAHLIPLVVLVVDDVKPAERGEWGQDSMWDASAIDRIAAAAAALLGFTCPFQDAWQPRNAKTTPAASHTCSRRPCAGCGAASRQRTQQTSCRAQNTAGNGPGRHRPPCTQRQSADAERQPLGTIGRLPTDSALCICPATKPPPPFAVPGIGQCPALLHAVLCDGGQHRIQRHAPEGHLQARTRHAELSATLRTIREQRSKRACRHTFICSQMSRRVGISPSLNSLSPANQVEGDAKLDRNKMDTTRHLHDGVLPCAPDAPKAK